MPATATPPTESDDDPQMSVVGGLVAAGSLLILLPLAPIIALLWVVDAFTGDHNESTDDQYTGSEQGV